MSDAMELVQNKDGTFSAYDDTYDIVIHCETEEEQKKVIERLESTDWIPVSKRLPETDDYILLSFANYSIPLVGRCERDKDGSGIFYAGDDLISCLGNDLFVNAWMELPKCYEGDLYALRSCMTSTTRTNRKE